MKLKNYFGYAIADLGNNIAFSVVGSYLTLYYTDVLGAHFDASTATIWSVAITVIFIFARIWDGVNDPIMGYIVQRAKPTKYGKFRPYLLYGGIPLAPVVVLMFAPFKNMPLIGCILFALFSYLIYEMLYTIVLVPYGSLAMVMTREQNERSRLSIMRSIGGGIGGIPSGLFPILVYSTYIDSTGAKVSVLDGNKLVIAMAVIAVIIIISYVTAFFNVEEQYPYSDAEQEIKLKNSLRTLIHNKPFLIICLAGMLLIASSMYIGTANLYLFNVYFQKTSFMIFVGLVTYAPMVIMIPFTELIIKKIGKKEICVFGLTLSVLATFIMAVGHIQNPWVFIALSFLQGCGISFFTLEIWAMAMDVIDYQEMLTKKREEAINYAIFTFTRKIGQAISSIVPALLAAVGYVAAKGYAGQDASTVQGIYTISTVVPLLMFILMLILMVLYPLNKKKEKEMREVLALQRADYPAAEGN